MAAALAAAGLAASAMHEQPQIFERRAFPRSIEPDSVGPLGLSSLAMALDPEVVTRSGRTLHVQANRLGGALARGGFVGCSEQRICTNDPIMYPLRNEARIPEGACGGLWVGENTMVTASHCVIGCGNEDQIDLHPIYVTSAHTPDRTFDGNSLRIEAGQWSAAAVCLLDYEADWALVRVDRPIQGVERFTGPLGVSKPRDASALHFPLGLPVKRSLTLTDPTWETDPRDHWAARLAVFDGSSGGPVFAAGQDWQVGLLGTIRRNAAMWKPWATDAKNRCCYATEDVGAPGALECKACGGVEIVPAQAFSPYIEFCDNARLSSTTTAAQTRSCFGDVLANGAIECPPPPATPRGAPPRP